MLDFEYFTISRALHVIGVVLWIGGVSFVTTVLIPSLKRINDHGNRLELFEKLEGAFSVQARIVTLVTGITGFYMLYFLEAWDRYFEWSFWWLHLMTFVWLIFTVVLFILEPLVLHRYFHEKASEDCDTAFGFLHVMHIILLSLSLIAVFGAVAGSHGFQF